MVSFSSLAKVLLRSFPILLKEEKHSIYGYFVQTGKDKSLIRGIPGF